MQVFMKYICHQTGITYAQDRNALGSISALELFGSLLKNEVTRGWLLSQVRVCDSTAQLGPAAPAVGAFKASAAGRSDTGGTAKVRPCSWNPVCKMTRSNCLPSFLSSSVKMEWILLIEIM